MFIRKPVNLMKELLVLTYPRIFLAKAAYANF